MSNRFTRRFEPLDLVQGVRLGQRYDKGDYTDRLLDKLLYDLIGDPSSHSAGKAERNITSSAGTGSDGTFTSAYTSAQNDVDTTTEKVGGSSSGTAIAAGIGILRDLLGYYHADVSAKLAYNKQNEYYDNHLSMPAKVQEYEDAGLNPMALTGAGVGATSAPSVDSATTPDASGAISVLGQILSYKLGLKEIATRNREIDVQAKNVASEIEYRATQRAYQEKINEWFEANQVATIEKMQAETKDALQRVNTGEADELLKYAGVSKTEAESALIFQEEMEKLWQNSPEWRQVELELKRAQSASGRANAAHLYEDIQNLGAARQNIMEDTALKVANTEIGRQQLKNLGLTEQQIQFAVDHQKGDLIWNRIGQVGSVLKDVGIGVGAAMSPIKGIPIGTNSRSQTSTIVQDGKGRTIRATESFTDTYTDRPNLPKVSKNYKMK